MKTQETKEAARCGYCIECEYAAQCILEDEFDFPQDAPCSLAEAH